MNDLGGVMALDLQNIHWRGYGRQDGSKGIRNKLLIVYTVECSSFVAKKIAGKLDDDRVDVVGFDGCCDNDYAVRLLLSLARHPNIGAVLAVGLGCEYVQPQLLAKKAAESGRPADWFFIQQHGGTLGSIEYGVQRARDLLNRLNDTPTVKMGFGDLVIGAECGGSDYTSGLAGNVLVGRFFDRLQDLGGTAVFEEIVEAVGLKDQLTSRAADDCVREQIAFTYDKALDYCKSVRQYSVSPGNFAGGLSSIEEKSMGAVVKSGTKPITGVLKVAQKPEKNGLWLLDSTPDPYWMQFGYTNPNDNEGLMDLISCGCQLVFLVTGRGNVVGSAVSPVFKITGNSDTYQRLSGDMDFNAGPVLSGESTVEELCDRLFKAVDSICSGAKTKAESLGHKEYFIPYKFQNRRVAVGKRCP
jgi:altronate hydrolase